MISEVIDYFTRNKEWIFSGIGIFFISLGIGALIGVVRLYCGRSAKRQERIDKFVDEFRILYHGGAKLPLLGKAGINTLKSNREIKKGLKTLILSFPGHPFRDDKVRNRVEKIGYKKFFGYVNESGSVLNKTSIVTFLNELQKKKGIKSKIKSYFASLSRGK